MVNGRNGSVTFNDKIIVGFAFIISCILGISMAFKPNWIHRIGEEPKSTIQKSTKQNASISREGHHPTCKNFKNHTFNINNIKYCAGCMGLAIGAVIAIISMCMYLINPLEMGRELTDIFLATGFMIIGLIFLKILTRQTTVSTHIISNTCLPLGFYLVVVGTLEYTGDVISSLIAVMISFLWLDTRIQISNWRHTVICRICENNCKVYKD
jgi:hypothetical protein